MPLRCLTIDLEAIVHNYNLLRTIQNKEVLPILKANAYGLGVLPIAKALLQSPHPPKIIGVASIDEAYQLRQLGSFFDILVFGFTKHEIEPLIENDFLISLSHVEHISTIHQATIKLEKIARVHVSIDTGMHRLGFLFDEAPFIIKQLKQRPAIHVEGIFSHYLASNSASFSQTTQNQALQLTKALNVFKNNTSTIKWVHLENTYGNIFHPVNETNMVRCGIGLYGPQIKACPLKPTLKLESEIISKMKIKKGLSAGYHKAFIAHENTSIGIIPLGYADGLPVDITSVEVAINNKNYPLIGTASMDFCWVDLGSSSVEIGDKVLFFNHVSGSFEKYQRQAGQSAHEVLTRLGNRISRSYINLTTPDKTTLSHQEKLSLPPQENCYL